MSEETPGDRVRRIRKTRGMTQAQLAEKARMARTDVVKVETNRLRLGQARMARIADALEVSVLELQPEAEADAPGLILLGRQEELEVEVLRLTRLVQGLARRVGALERQAPAGAPRAKAAR